MATTATDLRKSFNGLSAVVEHSLGQDPLSGHVYVFFNKRGNQVRCLYWDRTGYCIISKRLVRGCFRFTQQVNSESLSVELDAAELGLILEGIDLSKAVRRVRWRPTKAA